MSEQVNEMRGEMRGEYVMRCEVVQCKGECEVIVKVIVKVGDAHTSPALALGLLQRQYLSSAVCGRT